MSIQDNHDKEAKWIMYDKIIETKYCSICDMDVENTLDTKYYSYCPYCAAKIIGEDFRKMR